jgi:tRNA-specific 2-thiouridylase
VRCNDWLKFGRLHDYARQIDAAFVASGHYARIERDAQGRPRLLRGVDRGKDQSYVLFGAPRQRLEEMILPVGGLEKRRVRAIAAELGLPVFDKPDSQEICFVPDNDYAGLVRRRSPSAVRPGSIVDRSGRVLGEHPGHQHYTVGQRRGLGVAVGHPLYVIEKDPRSNTLVVGEKEHLFADGCRATDVNWHIDPPDGDWLACTAKVRYNADPAPAAVRSLGGGAIEVRFDEPQYAVAPGQAVVCYDGEAVVCGGWITGPP